MLLPVCFVVRLWERADAVGGGAVVAGGCVGVGRWTCGWGGGALNTPNGTGDVRDPNGDLIDEALTLIVRVFAGGSDGLRRVGPCGLSWNGGAEFGSEGLVEDLEAFEETR